MKEELAGLCSWMSDVYLPKLRSRDFEMVFEGGDVPEQQDGDGFSERFLQIVWNEQAIAREARTTDGRPLRILNGGTWNVAAGPDFQHASLVIGTQVLHGDVEIHRKTSDWMRHGHGKDPRYKNVILHVVWKHDGELPEGPKTTLELQQNMDSAWHVLLQDVEEACYPYARQVAGGQCSVRWALADNQSLQTVLASAGLACLSAKGERLRRSCAARGTDQALYEKFFDCLGFRHNRQAFRELTRQVPLSVLSQLESYEELEAVLFGASGLLPDATCEWVLPAWRDYVRRMWSLWWQSGQASLSLPWCRGGTRPYNSPERRLAAGARWLWMTHCRPREWLDQIGRETTDARQLVRAILNLDLGQTPWNAYKDFKSGVRPPAQLLGKQRLRDIVGNLALPYWVSLEDEGGGLSDLAREAFVGLSCGQGNRLITEAAHRFLSPPSRWHDLLVGYCHQQGLMDIYRNFCLVFNGDCESCPFGGREMRGGQHLGVGGLCSEGTNGELGEHVVSEPLGENVMRRQPASSVILELPS